jgi:hypothetical protein
VLIDFARQDEDMLAVVVIAAIVLLYVLAYTSGVDSRVDDVARRRRYHG